MVRPCFALESGLATLADIPFRHDNLLMSNLGFMDDSQIAVDPELSHLFGGHAKV
jgi:hypothetical protein